jgi:hypothetical protein
MREKIRVSGEMEGKLSCMKVNGRGHIREEVACQILLQSDVRERWDNTEFSNMDICGGEVRAI